MPRPGLISGGQSGNSVVSHGVSLDKHPPPSRSWTGSSIQVTRSLWDSCPVGVVVAGPSGVRPRLVDQYLPVRGLGGTPVGRAEAATEGSLTNQPPRRGAPGLVARQDGLMPIPWRKYLSRWLSLFAAWCR